MVEPILTLTAGAVLSYAIPKLLDASIAKVGESLTEGAIANTAYALYVQIGDKYSQGRILVLSIAPAQLKLGLRDAAVESLTRAAALGAGIQVAPLQDYALERLASIQNETL